ncbi:MAG TPA: hypothetical protein VFC67_24705 [Prolixibacteraceae bacterium]|nr:hypothetical protein [Prolixibacteraceae bacterium]
MKYVVVFIIVLLSFKAQIFAQEIDTLVDKIPSTAKSRAFPEFAGMQMPPDSVSIPVLHRDPKSGFELQNPVLPNMNFNMTNGWKTETGSLPGLSGKGIFPFLNNPLSLYGGSILDVYQGIYGIRTYQLNNNLSVGTAGYSERSFNEYLLKSGINRQTNYGSTLFVGYKFSDKFSISASFTFRRNGDRFNRNQGMLNGSFFP